MRMAAIPIHASMRMFPFQALIRDYAAALVAAFQKWFLDSFAREKSPKISVLEAESSPRRYDSIIFAKKASFS